MQVHQNTTLTATNLMTYRGWHTPQQLRAIAEKLEAYIATHGGTQTGKLIVALYATCQTTGATDAQVYLPVDKVLPDGQGFAFVPQLTVHNCLLVHFEGTPGQVPEVFAALLQEAASMGRNVIPPAYVVVMEGHLVADCDRLEADVYVEVGERMEAQ